MRLLFTLLIALLLTAFPVNATPAIIEYDGTASIASGATKVFLDGGTGTHQFHHVIVWLSASSSTAYLTFNPGATASSSNALLASGAGLAFGLGGAGGGNAPATNQINYYGNGTTGTISWVAW